MKPDSAVLQMATIYGGDTTWTTYSTGQSGCGTNFSTSLLVNPIFSPNTIQSIAEHGPELVQPDGDTVVLTFTSGPRTYSYFVEKQRWLIVGLDITGDISYNAGYYYADSSGIPVLQMIAIGSDTTLQNGGVRFKSIRLNLPLHAKRLPALRRNGITFQVSAGRVVVSGDALARGSGIVTVRNAAGRVLFSGELSPGKRRLVWDGRSVSGRPVAAGTCVLELSVDGEKLFYPFTLLQ